MLVRVRYGAAVPPRAAVDCACRGITGAEPSEVSLLHFLAYVRASGGVKPLISIEKGHQERKFVLGAQTVSDRVRVNRSCPPERTTPPSARLTRARRRWTRACR